MTDLLEYARELAETGDYDKAYIIANKKLMDTPTDANWLSLMTYIMLETDKPVFAYHLAKSVTDLASRNANAWLNLGMACRDMRHDKDALRYFKRGLKYAINDDQRSMLCVNLSSTLVDTGEYAEAEEYCHKALEYRPDSNKALVNLGFCQLAQRNWSEGWANYRKVIGHDWRPKFQYNGEPLWDGESKGKIVIYGEQGIGDQISFASMLRDAQQWAKANDSELIVDVDPKLEGVMQRSFPDITVHGTLGANGAGWPDKRADYSLPIGQLGEYFRLTDDAFPGKAYLRADPDRALQWKSLFRSKNKPVIGLAWSGGIPKTGSKFRRVSLEDLLPVMQSVDAHFVSLQYKPAGKEIARFKAEHPEIDLVEYPWGTLTNDYDDTVAMVSAMDGVVAMHTSVCHAAGGLGIPCLTLVPKNSQWRYGAGTEDFLWADSVELIRQEKTGEWGDVITRTAERLVALLKGIRQTAGKAARGRELWGNRPEVRKDSKRNNRQARAKKSA